MTFSSLFFGSNLLILFPPMDNFFSLLSFLFKLVMSSKIFRSLSLIDFLRACSSAFFVDSLEVGVILLLLRGGICGQKFIMPSHAQL